MQAKHVNDRVGARVKSDIITIYNGVPNLHEDAACHLRPLGRWNAGRVLSILIGSNAACTS